MLQMIKLNIDIQYKKIKFTYKPYFISAHRKNLPDFIIIGAQKSGTSTLAYNLHRHSDIYMARDSYYTEVKFFSNEKRWRRGINWYKGFFTQSDCLQGEKSPEYLFNKKCHSRMHNMVPSAKLIILLRNPVDRAYSQWNHYNQVYDFQSKYWGWEKTDFETAIRMREEVIKRGEYINQITHLLRFFSKEQMHICITERLQKKPHSELEKIWSFLDVSSKTLEFHNRNVREYPSPMKEETRKKLHVHFQSFNELLFDYLGYSIPEWEL